MIGPNSCVNVRRKLASGGFWWILSDPDCALYWGLTCVLCHCTCISTITQVCSSEGNVDSRNVLFCFWLRFDEASEDRNKILSNFALKFGGACREKQSPSLVFLLKLHMLPVFSF